MSLLDQGDMLVRPKGFDRSAAGRQLAPVEVEIDRSQVRFLAQVLGLTAPIHFDVERARSNGYRDLVAPASFFMVIEAAAEEVRRQRSEPTLFEAIAADFRYLLHGEERYVYLTPVCAGDRVTLSATVGDFTDKKGGLIESVTVRSEIIHPVLGPLVRADRTLLHRFG
jgi:acyl dehydratase